MVVSNIGGIDRVDLYEPLMCILDMTDMKESKKDPYLSFQVEYAAQALLNVSSDEEHWHAGFRRLLLAIAVDASFAKIPDPKEIKMVLEGLEKLYKEGRRDFVVMKKTIKAKGKGCKFIFKDGIQFKSIWYRALRTVELYIQTGKLTYFEEFVTNAQCRNDRMFQLGVCQILGQFVTDARWELEARQDAVAFIKELYQKGSSWELHDDAKQVIYDVLTNLECNHSSDFEDAKILLEEMRQQNPTWRQIAQLDSHPWMKSCHSTRQGPQKVFYWSLYSQNQI
ncbi:hypothetical protein FBU30_009741 [Linnemannia zychae]|nr:hypothetical protein FBU30_009741 [Linnemannia zychae]